MDVALTPARSPRFSIPRLGTACLASGVLGVIIGFLSLVYPAAVSHDQWSYPFPSGVALGVGIVLAVTHVLTLLGFLGVLLVDPHAGQRSASIALWVAVLGLTALTFCELASGAIAGDRTESTSADVVGGLFGVASLLIAVGSIVAGVVVARVRRWTGAARWALLASGLILVLLVTPANISGNRYAIYPALMLWSLMFVPLGQAVMASASRRR